MDTNLKLKVRELNSGEVSKIKETWEKVFVPVGIDREKIHIDNMLWHIFSYKVKACSEGKEAISAYEEVMQDSCYIFYQRLDIGYMIDDIAGAFTIDDLNQFITDFETKDIYVTDQGFNWTYVQTHEDGWPLGPYFCKR